MADRPSAIAQQYRLNAGVIVEEPMIDIRLQSSGRPTGAGGRNLGQLEEYFIEQLTPGDTFVFAGQVLRFEGIRETAAFVSRTKDTKAQVPSYNGGKFPLSTFLAHRVREMVSKPETLEPPARSGAANGCASRNGARSCRKPGQLLVETFPRGRRNYLVCYPFEGRLAHQTLGMLLTRRLDGCACARSASPPTNMRWRCGACATWAGSIWASCSTRTCWATISTPGWRNPMLYKRTFRNCAIIAGLIERRTPANEKTGRQVTFSSDLIYDVLRAHEPDHILLRATYEDAGTGLLDIARLADMLKRIKGQIVTRPLDRVSPLAVPALLEISKEMVAGEAHEDILHEAEEALIADAMRLA